MQVGRTDDESLHWVPPGHLNFDSARPCAIWFAGDRNGEAAHPVLDLEKLSLITDNRRPDACRPLRATTTKECPAQGASGRRQRLLRGWHARIHKPQAEIAAVNQKDPLQFRDDFFTSRSERPAEQPGVDLVSMTTVGTSSEHVQECRDDITALRETPSVSAEGSSAVSGRFLCDRSSIHSTVDTCVLGAARRRFSSAGNAPGQPKVSLAPSGRHPRCAP